MLRFLTAGESHGAALTGIIEGIPSNLRLSTKDIDPDLARRQGGFGRGGRMKIEKDRALILSGVRWGRTLGSPITLLVENLDWANWQKGMSVEESGRGSIGPVTRPRPGHADLAGALKYDTTDVRNILERSSARETAMRVALGAVAKKFLAEFGVLVGSYVIEVGGVRVSDELSRASSSKAALTELFERAEASPVRCPEEAASKKMIGLIEKAIRAGDSLGGVFEVFVSGLPAGLGSHIQWDRRLDGRLAQALMSIQAIKAVEIGAGMKASGRPGSDVQDEIFYAKKKGVYRKTNNSGGIEGGMTNGMPVLARAAMKPIPTLKRPLKSVDIRTKKALKAAYERSDTCAVPAAAVIGEAMAALTIAAAFIEKFGGDSVAEVKKNHAAYLDQIARF